jgi:hypothetical protein
MCFGARLKPASVFDGFWDPPQFLRVLPPRRFMFCGARLKPASVFDDLLGPASNPPQFLRVFRLGVARLAVFDVFVVPA